MILLTITNVKRKIKKLTRVVVFLLILGLALPAFLGLVSTYVSSTGVKFKEERPTGQPLQVEKNSTVPEEAAIGQNGSEPAISSGEKEGTGARDSEAKEKENGAAGSEGEQNGAAGSEGQEAVNGDGDSEVTEGANGPRDSEEEGILDRFVARFRDFYKIDSN